MSEPPSRFFEENLPLIRQITASVCRRLGVTADEIDDFISELLIHLMNGDYAVIRKFRGRSSFATYLAAVATRLLLDYRNHRLGKWHDSAEAERLGPLAIDVERALYRDGLSADEAFASLAARHPSLTRAHVETLAARLPRRIRRKRVDLNEATTMASPDPAADPAKCETARLISKIVGSYIKGISENDQLMMRLRFEHGLTIADISRSLRVEQQTLYRHLYKHFQRLRVELEKAGIGREDVAALIGNDAVFLDFGLKNRELGPSEEPERGAPARQEELP
jgi:RNA polymerase sigma factor (sigma-70 family)